MGIAIILVQDKLLTDLERLVAAGRLLGKNIPAARALLEEFLDWIEVQREGYIPGDVICDNEAMEAFCKAAQAEFHAQRKAVH